MKPHLICSSGHREIEMFATHDTLTLVMLCGMFQVNDGSLIFLLTPWNWNDSCALSRTWLDDKPAVHHGWKNFLACVGKPYFFVTTRPNRMAFSENCLEIIANSAYLIIFQSTVHTWENCKYFHLNAWFNFFLERTVYTKKLSMPLGATKEHYGISSD